VGLGDLSWHAASRLRIDPLLGSQDGSRKIYTTIEIQPESPLQDGMTCCKRSEADRIVGWIHAVRSVKVLNPSRQMGRREKDRIAASRYSARILKPKKQKLVNPDPSDRRFTES